MPNDVTDAHQKHHTHPILMRGKIIQPASHRNETRVKELPYSMYASVLWGEIKLSGKVTSKRRMSIKSLFFS